MTPFSTPGPVKIPQNLSGPRGCLSKCRQVLESRVKVADCTIVKSSLSMLELRGLDKGQESVLVLLTALRMSSRTHL